MALIMLADDRIWRRVKKQQTVKRKNISIAGASNTGGFIGNSSDSVFENCEASEPYPACGRWEVL